MWYTKRVHDTWKVVKGMSLFNFDLIFDSDLCYTATGRAIFTDLVRNPDECQTVRPPDNSPPTTSPQYTDN